MIWLAASWLLGCAAPVGDSDTLVTKLRTIGVVVEPPEVRPGESMRVTIDVLDPEGGDLDVLGWFCFPSSDGRCVVPQVGDLSLPLDTFTAVVRDASPTTTVDFEGPDALSALFAATGPDDVDLFFLALACRPGLCPLIDDVEANPTAGSPAWRAAVDALGDGILGLRSIPIEGTSVAQRRFLLSDRSSFVRNQNPALFLRVDPGSTVPTGSQVAMAFASTDTLVFPFTTGGAFEFEVYAVASSFPVTMRWITPDDPGRHELVVVAEDGLGGSATWRRVFEVVEQGAGVP